VVGLLCTADDLPGVHVKRAESGERFSKCIGPYVQRPLRGGAGALGIGSLRDRRELLGRLVDQAINLFLGAITACIEVGLCDSVRLGNGMAGGISGDVDSEDQGVGRRLDAHGFLQVPGSDPDVRAQLL